MIDVTAARHIWPKGWEGTSVSWETLSMRVAIARDQATSFGTDPRGFAWNDMARNTESVLAFWGQIPSRPGFRVR